MCGSIDGDHAVSVSKINTNDCTTGLMRSPATRSLVNMQIQSKPPAATIKIKDVYPEAT